MIEKWRKHIVELTQFEISDYTDPESEVNLFKNRLGTAQRLGKVLVMQNNMKESFKVLYKAPYWLIIRNGQLAETLKDVPDVVDYLAGEHVLFDTVEIIE